MHLLVEIHEVTIYKLPKSENVVIGSLAKLVKELTYMINETISIEVQNWHVLAPISIKFIESREEIDILEDDLVAD